jgi:TolB-like protein
MRAVLRARAFTELVTASLAQRGSIVVLSRPSASRIDARHNSVPAIARELGVDLVLESSVTRTPRRIRVVSQLIDGRSDEHLWTGRYDRESGDTLGLQAEIADQIAAGIEAAASEYPSRPSGKAVRTELSAIATGSVARGHAVPHSDLLSPSEQE